MNLNDRDWKALKIEDLFIISRGKRHIEENRISGNIPYYSATQYNNGLTDFISNPLFIKDNSLIITTFCDAYFVKGYFTASDEITILKNDELNIHNGLFISKMIHMNKNKYSFGRKAFYNRLGSQKIMIPVTKEDDTIPDWEYMEQYIKNLMNKKYNEYISYI